MTKIVAVTGVAPAVGTSTLAKRLRDWMISRGLVVDLVEEDEVLTRPVFAPMARELVVTGACAVHTLTDCVVGFVEDGIRSNVDVVLCDALFPFVRSLSDWDNGEIAIDGFLAACTDALAPVSFTLIYLDGDVRAALQHAATREPAGWLDWWISNLVRNQPATSQNAFDRAVSSLSRERDMALHLMASHGWDVRRIPEVDLLTADEALDRAQRHLDLSLA